MVALLILNPSFAPLPPSSSLWDHLKKMETMGHEKKKGFNYFLLFPKVPSALGSSLAGHE